VFLLKFIKKDERLAKAAIKFKKDQEMEKCSAVHVDAEQEILRHFMIQLLILIKIFLQDCGCQSPKNLHSDSDGTGNFAPIGGRIKQLVAFTKATLAEAAGVSNPEEQTEMVNATAEAVRQVASSEEEIEEIAKEMENDQQT
jgi:hypothetical protein